MNRSPLKRKTKLKPVSDKKAAWLVKYRKAVKERLQWMIEERGCYWDELTGETAPAEILDPHHPDGRIGAKIFNFKMTTRKNHTFIHEHANEARKLGWLV